MNWKRVGSFWLGHDSSGLRVLAPDGSELQLSGALACAIWEPPPRSPLLQAAALRNPQLARLVHELEAAEPEPLNRRTLLRGTGYHTLFVELTAQCNERCVHCYADAGPERTEALPWSVVEAVLEDAARLGYERVQLTGGDPLIAATLVRAVARARALGIPQIELYTNGLALTDALLAVLRPSAPHFAFSLYAASPDVHDAITRVPGSHARTLRAIRACLAEGLSVRVGATLLAHTLSEREPLRELLIATGVAPSQIGFVTSHEVGRGSFVEGHNDAGQHAAGALGAGKAAVLADGSVVPCIFARSSVLGNVHREALFDVLGAELPVTCPPELDLALGRANSQLSCSECRMRSVFLTPADSAAPMIQLRRRS